MRRMRANIADKTYNVEERCNDLLGVRDHTLNLSNLALLVLEDDLLASNRVRLFPARLRHPLRGGPHRTGDVVNMDCMRRIFAGRVSGTSQYLSRANDNRETYKAFIVCLR